MPLSRQSLASVADLLGTVSWDSAGLLLYKHLGVRIQDLAHGAMGRLDALEAADPDAVWQLVGELARETAGSGGATSTPSTGASGKSSGGSCTTAGSSNTVRW